MDDDQFARDIKEFLLKKVYYRLNAPKSSPAGTNPASVA